MPFELVPKEKVMKPAESWFANTIAYIENYSEMRLTEEDKIVLISTYNWGVKNCINQLNDFTDKVVYERSLKSIYALGIGESIESINDMIVHMEKDYLNNDIGVERIHILVIRMFIKGIEDITDLYRRNRLNNDIKKLIEDVDNILSVYLEDLNEPEQAWENIRRRIGFGNY